MPRCVLHVKDEVNVKLEGLELTERRKLAKKFSFEVPGARYMPAVRLGRWDGCVSFFQLGGSTYINLLDQILPEISHYEIEIEDHRDYNTKFEFDEVSETTYSDKAWPKGHPVEGEPILLRDYQVELINNFLTNPQCIQEVATGAGKTIMLSALIGKRYKKGKKILVLQHRDELVGQNATKFTRVNPKISTSVVDASQKHWDGVMI